MKSTLVPLLFALVALVASAFANPPNGFSPSGQHLIIDAAGCESLKINDLDYVQNQTLDLINQLNMTVLGVSGSRLEPQGVSVTIALAESHLTVHTWPEHQVALIDIFTCGAANIKGSLELFVETFSCDLKLTNWTFINRGYGEESDDLYDNVLSRSNVKKSLVTEEESQYQGIHIYDLFYDPYRKFLDSAQHRAMNDQSIAEKKRTGMVKGSATAVPVPADREFYLDGVIQSSTSDEKKCKS
jgi:S-adenosylmethionine decarboxylase